MNKIKVRGKSMITAQIKRAGSDTWEDLSLELTNQDKLKNKLGGLVKWLTRVF